MEEILHTEESHLIITYSDIYQNEGVYGDPNDMNINADPLFLDPNAGDYHLQTDSPCVDAGSDIGASDIDIEENPRPSGGGYDIGAFEALTYVYYYYDNDGDGYGDPNESIQAFYSPEDYVFNNFDCDDENQNVNPDAFELCNSMDDNCNGRIDEEGALDCTLYYMDFDHDTFGSNGDSRCLCFPEGDYTETRDGDVFC